MSWLHKVRATATVWTARGRARIIRLFWATHDDKYIVTDQGLKILFRKEGGYTKKPRNLL
jgi:hypothetical protein